MDLLAVPFLSRKLSSGIDTRRDRGGVEDPAEHEDAYLLSQEDKEFMAKMKHEQEETLEEERLDLERKPLSHCVLVAV
mgnify:CR=1 FL=1